MPPPPVVGVGRGGGGVYMIKGTGGSGEQGLKAKHEETKTNFEQKLKVGRQKLYLYSFLPLIYSYPIYRTHGIEN